MMLDVEQFVYTAAEIDGKKGYQVVAKSKGITDKTLLSLEPYAYPVGMDPGRFEESRSLVFLDGDQAAYSRIRNIGVGYDGRTNTIYNHSFVFSKKDFEKYDNDSRIFDPFYLECQAARGCLPTLSINPPIPAPAIANARMKGVPRDVLAALFTNKKIALLADGAELPQEILSLVPKSLRTISFSTLVVEPAKQPRYHFILNSGLHKSQIGKDFEVIGFKVEAADSPETDFEQSLTYYIGLIKAEDGERLTKMWEMYEKLPGDSNAAKLVLLGNYFQHMQAVDEESKSLHANKVLEALEQFDHDTFSLYFEEIKNSLGGYQITKKQPRPEIPHHPSLFGSMILMPVKIAIDAYDAFLNPQRQNERKKHKTG